MATGAASAGLRAQVADLNSALVCRLCDGYLVDATVAQACGHTFCRSCIVLYLRASNDRQCPLCAAMVGSDGPTVGAPQPHAAHPLLLRSDKTLQTLVYKIVPGLYDSEMKRRRRFYQQQQQQQQQQHHTCTDGGALDEMEASVKTHSPHIYTDDEMVQLRIQLPVDRPEMLQSSVTISHNHKITTIPIFENGVQPPHIASVEKCRFLLCRASTPMACVLKLLRLKLFNDKHTRSHLSLKLVACGCQTVMVEDSWTVTDLAYVLKHNPDDPISLRCHLTSSTLPTVECKQSELQVDSYSETSKSSAKRSKCSSEEEVRAKKPKLSHVQYHSTSIKSNSHTTESINCFLKKKHQISVGSPLLAHSYRKSKLVSTAKKSLSFPVVSSGHPRLSSENNDLRNTIVSSSQAFLQRSHSYSSSLSSNSLLADVSSVRSDVSWSTVRRCSRDSQSDFKRSAIDSERVSFVTDKLHHVQRPGKPADTKIGTPVAATVPVAVTTSSPPVVLKFWKTIANSKVMYTTTPSSMSSKLDSLKPQPVTFAADLKTESSDSFPTKNQVTTAACQKLSDSINTSTVSSDVTPGDGVKSSRASSCSYFTTPVQSSKLNVRKNASRLDDIISTLSRNRVCDSSVNLQKVTSPYEKNISSKDSIESSIRNKKAICENDSNSSANNTIATELNGKLITIAPQISASDEVSASNHNGSQCSSQMESSIKTKPISTSFYEGEIQIHTENAQCQPKYSDKVGALIITQSNQKVKASLVSVSTSTSHSSESLIESSGKEIPVSSIDENVSVKLDVGIINENIINTSKISMEASSVVTDGTVSGSMLPISCSSYFPVPSSHPAAQMEALYNTIKLSKFQPIVSCPYSTNLKSSNISNNTTPSLSSPSHQTKSANVTTFGTFPSSIGDRNIYTNTLLSPSRAIPSTTNVNFTYTPGPSVKCISSYSSQPCVTSGTQKFPDRSIDDKVAVINVGVQTSNNSRWDHSKSCSSRDQSSGQVQSVSLTAIDTSSTIVKSSYSHVAVPCENSKDRCFSEPTADTIVCKSGETIICRSEDTTICRSSPSRSLAVSPTGAIKFTCGKAIQSTKQHVVDMVPTANNILPLPVSTAVTSSNEAMRHLTDSIRVSSSSHQSFGDSVSISLPTLISHTHSSSRTSREAGEVSRDRLLHGGSKEIDHTVRGKRPVRSLPIKIPKYPPVSSSRCRSFDFNISRSHLVPFSTHYSNPHRSPVKSVTSSIANLVPGRSVITPTSVNNLCNKSTSVSSHVADTMHPLDLSMRSEPRTDVRTSEQSVEPPSYRYKSRRCSQSPRANSNEPDGTGSVVASIESVNCARQNSSTVFCPASLSPFSISSLASLPPLSIRTDIPFLASPPCASPLDTSYYSWTARQLALRHQQQLQLLLQPSTGTITSSSSSWSPGSGWSSSSCCAPPGQLKKSSPVAGCTAPPPLSSPPQLAAASLRRGHHH